MNYLNYLGKSGLIASNVSKAKDVAARVTVREHSRGRALPRSGAEMRESASPNYEGNESPAYEKLEKRTLRSLKGGGTAKELREGHNTGMKATMDEWKSGKLHSGSKTGPVVKSQKQAVAIAMSKKRREK